VAVVEDGDLGASNVVLFKDTLSERLSFRVLDD
jgi:hypothetical protein